MNTLAQPGGLRRPLRGAEMMKTKNSQMKSDHAGLTQGNKPPRKPVRFSHCLPGTSGQCSAGRHTYATNREARASPRVEGVQSVGRYKWRSRHLA